jgi:hypothetical protein
MAVGLQITGTEINNTAGVTARNVYTALDAVVQFKAWLDSVGDATLLSSYGVSNADAAVLRSAYTDLAQLATVFNGTGTRASVYDYRTFAKQLIGTGLY